ncbi:MAG TPA: ATP-binding protein, partial [Ilumatobacteraceae bacterium]|nr:ATP-binding protein [Ilumatobacteraceae bacterium]
APTSRTSARCGAPRADVSDAGGARHADVHDGPSVHVRLRLPRQARTIAVVRDMVSDALVLVGAPMDVIADVRIALSEACGNAVEHATGAEYEVAIDVDADRCTATVTDRGDGLTEEAIGAAMPGPDTLRGRGLPIMRALADDVVVTVQPGVGTSVQLVKRLDGPSGPS